MYSWYSPRQQADLTANASALDHGHKPSRTGQFYDPAADPDEAKPLKVSDLAGPAAAAKKLQAALDTFDLTGLPVASAAAIS